MPDNCKTCKHSRFMALFVTVHWYCDRCNNRRIGNSPDPEQPLTPPTWCPLKEKADAA